MSLADEFNRDRVGSDASAGIGGTLANTAISDMDLELVSFFIIISERIISFATNSLVPLYCHRCVRW